MFITLKESRIESNKSFYGSFYLGSFDAGQSITVANALRRSLLSDGTGLAIISIKIENVQHEYSTLPGVRDSVLDILLNFKEIVLKKLKNPFGGPTGYKNKGFSAIYDKIGSTFFKPVVGYLKVKGPGIIRAKDLRLPPFIQCVDPNQYIATLAEDGCISAKFVIMEGKSYYIGKTSSKSNTSVSDKSKAKSKSSFFDGKRKNLLNSTSNTESTSDLGDNSNYWTIMKKRENLLKQLKEIMSKDEKMKADGEEFNSEKQTPNLSVPPDFKKSSQHINPFMHKKNNSELFINTFNENSKQLNIDAVFSPVTKVNYIIEGYDNYIIQSFNEKYKLIESFTSFLDSAKFLQTNFPYFSEKWNPEESVNNTSSDYLEARKQNISNDFMEKNNNIEDFSFRKGPPEGSPFKKRGGGQNIKSSGLKEDHQKKIISKNLLDYITNLSTSDLSILCTPEGYSHYKGIGIPSSFTESILPSKLNTESFAGAFEWGLNVSSKQVVLLEIWTNGSVHPRDALLMAFKSLNNTFSPEKIKMTNPIFSNSSSYKKILENL